MASEYAFPDLSDFALLADAIAGPSQLELFPFGADLVGALLTANQEALLPNTPIPLIVELIEPCLAASSSGTDNEIRSEPRVEPKEFPAPPSEQSFGQDPLFDGLPKGPTEFSRPDLNSITDQASQARFDPADSSLDYESLAAREAQFASDPQLSAFHLEDRSTYFLSTQPRQQELFDVSLSRPRPRQRKLHQTSFVGLPPVFSPLPGANLQRGCGRYTSIAPALGHSEDGSVKRKSSDSGDDFTAKRGATKIKAPVIKGKVEPNKRAEQKNLNAGRPPEPEADQIANNVEALRKRVQREKMRVCTAYLALACGSIDEAIPIFRRVWQGFLDKNTGLNPPELSSDVWDQFFVKFAQPFRARTLDRSSLEIAHKRVILAAIKNQGLGRSCEEGLLALLHKLFPDRNAPLVEFPLNQEEQTALEACLCEPGQFQPSLSASL
eukprot:m.299929 g.299929  ORF g.299929 m.299929 type:complete len:439 (+) comp55201_c0_seq8:68-1384(+)